VAPACWESVSSILDSKVRGQSRFLRICGIAGLKVNVSGIVASTAIVHKFHVPSSTVWSVLLAGIESLGHAALP